MNAKFEKWFYDNNMESIHALGVSDILMENDDGSYVQTWVQKQFDAWMGAIDSLEVTTELVHNFSDEIADQIGSYANDEDCRIILGKVLSALKEQAK